MKGSSKGDESVMLNENEMHHLTQLSDADLQYIVMHYKSTPILFRIQNPAKVLNLELKTKEVQYFSPMAEWKDKVNMK